MPTAAEFTDAANKLDNAASELEAKARATETLRTAIPVEDGGTFPTLIDSVLGTVVRGLTAAANQAAAIAAELRVRAARCAAFTAEMAKWQVANSEYWRAANRASPDTDVGTPPVQPRPAEPWIEAG